jgi:hypothetical protein
MLQIDHDSRAHRLSAELDDKVMSITHTRVPRPIGGRGVAAELMRSALDLAAANGWKLLDKSEKWPRAHRSDIRWAGVNEPACGGQLINSR